MSGGTYAYSSIQFMYWLSVATAVLSTQQQALLFVTYLNVLVLVSTQVVSVRLVLKSVMVKRSTRGCIPFYKCFQTAVKCCSQGGVRSGAATIVLPTMARWSSVSIGTEKQPRRWRPCSSWTTVYSWTSLCTLVLFKVATSACSHLHYLAFTTRSSKTKSVLKNTLSTRTILQVKRETD